ncbi:MAG TPA: Smr/MutS family protein [Thermoanaerobaculia bacterium]|nr:Smr/MutS family protein [Thermoanaerobaculia bacterium]
MSSFAPNDPVQVAALGIGKGVIRELRNREHYLVDVNGRHIVASSSQLRRCARRWPRRARWYVTAPRRHGAFGPSCECTAMIDLHGNTVYDAIGLVVEFLNDALLTGVVRVRIIHGRSGGKIRAALHKLLPGMPSVRGWALDQHNPGVTVVRL